MIHLSRVVSRRLTYVLLAVQVSLGCMYLYRRHKGNPMRMAVDEHGVLRFLSQREYAMQELQVSDFDAGLFAVSSSCGMRYTQHL